MIRKQTFSLLLFQLLILSVLLPGTVVAQNAGRSQPLNKSDTAKGITLSTVTITNKKPKLIKLGVHNYTPFVWAGITNHDRNDTYEQARLIKIDRPSHLISANVLSAGKNNGSDSIKYRLNIYRVNQGFPGEKLVTKSFVQSFSPTENIFTFDLRTENIILAEDCVVSFEFLQQDKAAKIPVISLRAKLGSAGGFIRLNKASDWKVMKGGGASIYLVAEQ